jgi:outer membrane protein FlgP
MIKPGPGGHMKLNAQVLYLIWLCCLLTGCASVINKDQTQASNPTDAKVLRVTTYSRFDDSESLSIGQRWLKAQQNTKIEAYRALATQLYKQELPGAKTVGAKVTENEAFRIYLDVFLRDARAIDYRTVNDTLSGTFEISLSPRFYQCMSGKLETVSQCLEDDHKLQMTRLGFRNAYKTSANLACEARDCSDLLQIKGYADEHNGFDNALLDAGLYDGEWGAHTGLSLFGRLMLFQGLVRGF